MSDAKFDAFLFYRSYREAINGMTAKDQLATLLAIIDYALYGIEPDLMGKMPTAVFTVVRPLVDANNGRQAGGKKSGRPKKKTIGFGEDETIGFQNEKPDALNNRETEEQRNKETEGVYCGCAAHPLSIHPPDCGGSGCLCAGEGQQG